MFDHDGTLWVEYPMYTQVLFAFERVKELAPQHPEWKTKQPFKAVLEGNMQALAASGKKGLLELVMATHANMTTVEFESVVSDWLYSARHPKFNRPYTDLVYQHRWLGYIGQKNLIKDLASGSWILFIDADEEISPELRDESLRAT